LYFSHAGGYLEKGIRTRRINVDEVKIACQQRCSNGVAK